MSTEQPINDTVPVDDKISDAENAKKLGNESFAVKKFDEAITHYNEAIRLDPNNAVFYSNRSACYASMQNWQLALEDALQCVGKDSNFIKGYFRLSIAQSELGYYDDAETTLRAALAKEPENDQALRQIRTLRTKKAAAMAAVKKPPARKQMDEAQMKEYMELQDQTNGYARDLKNVSLRLSALQRDAKLNQITQTQIEVLDTEIPLYRAVGKAFFFTAKDDIKSRLDKELDLCRKNEKDLFDRKEYLERRLISSSQNLKDMLA